MNVRLTISSDNTWFWFPKWIWKGRYFALRWGWMYLQIGDAEGDLEDLA